MLVVVEGAHWSLVVLVVVETGIVATIYSSVCDGENNDDKMTESRKRGELGLRDKNLSQPGNPDSDNG